jgi:hypothetical protein
VPALGGAASARIASAPSTVLRAATAATLAFAFFVTSGCTEGTTPDCSGDAAGGSCGYATGFDAGSDVAQENTAGDAAQEEPAGDADAG